MNKSTVPTTSASNSDQVNPRKPKKKVYRVRLPTPPPDPRGFAERDTLPTNQEKIKEKDAEFLDYLENLQKFPNPTLARSASIFAPTVAAEDAFDQLDRLYKLMEQMLVLREQNAKLHRRIRDLEHFRNLQNLHKNIDHIEALECPPDFDRDSAFAESVLDTILLSTKRDNKSKLNAPSRFRQSLLRRQRNRGGSVSLIDKTPDYDVSGIERRSSTVITPNSDKSAKVSKWTKVKAAFKWEKAAATLSGIKTPESDSGLVPLNYEVARYLRVPSTSEDVASSPVDSGAAGISTPGTISSASSLDDLHFGRKGEFSSEDDQYAQLDYIPQYKEETNVQKTCKGPVSRTRWAKMKDIIQPKNSIKKRYRLSGRSDDFKCDDSDNEDVFILDPVPTKTKLEKHPRFTEESHRIPPEVIERYKSLIAEDNMKTDPEVKISRWTRVKKAFLTSTSISKSTNEDENANIQAPCCTQDPLCKTFNHHKIHDEIEKNYKQLQKKLSLEFHDKMHEWEKNKLHSPGHSTGSSHPKSIPMTNEENLPTEFKKKLQEWQKIKKGSVKEEPSSSVACKKKIGEMPKCKSVGGYKTENSPIDQRPLSHDFLKKLETWKQIKAGTMHYSDDSESKRCSTETKTPSPRMARKDSTTRQSKKFKEQTDKELQWFEKELGKIEREKQRLERERQKFLEREERLSKLRKSVIGNNKQEVFVHTPSGFYRFEGISRKFTQKLYEWEKAQGIGPEESTFALLTSSCTPEITLQPPKRDLKSGTLYRSKSADSIANSTLNLMNPILSEQPSSLSLNDVENLENSCILESRVSSLPDVTPSNENMLSDEPEAVIVEIEDVYEETASPLVTFFGKEETPVYQQQQEFQKLCEGKRNSGPKIRRSESTRAQTNYNLIEDVIKILRCFADTEKDIENAENGIEKVEYLLDDSAIINKKIKLQKLYGTEVEKVENLVQKITWLQQENSNVAVTITNEENGVSGSHISDVLENIQDLSSELIQLVEKLSQDLHSRNKNGPQEDSINYTKANYPNIWFSLKLLNTKILEIRRELSYICAASDLTAPSKKKKYQKRGILRRKSEENEEKRYGARKKSTSNVEDSSSSMDNAPCPVGQGAIRKRIKYRQKEPSFYKVVNESDENEETSRETRRIKQKRFSRSRSGSENNSMEVVESPKKVEDPTVNPESILVDPDIVQKVVVPTVTNFVNSDRAAVELQHPDSPVTIFVKTTRKLFTPIATTSLNDFDAEEKSESNANFDDSVGTNLNRTRNFLTKTPSFSKSSETLKNESIDEPDQLDKTIPLETVQSQKYLNHLPPLPASPIVQRKIMKDISPSIRIMMVKYNQKVSEQDNSGHRSGGSSGSASPTAWRSPILERRVRAQTEKYEEEINKLSPLLGRREVQKSASLGLLYAGRKQVTVHGKPEDTSPESSPKSKRGILKSPSSNVLSDTDGNKNTNIQENITVNPYNNEVKASLKLTMPSTSCASESSCTPPDIRKLKILKAREEFLNSSIASPSSAPTPPPSKESSLQYPKSRLSQVSVGSESSCDSSAYGGWLVKSASAGMINVDPDVYKQFDPAFHQDGYVSLPRSTKKSKENFLSSLTSKFRKVKMRRSKDPSKMSTISTLCRQSLIVDISSDSQENIQKQSDSSKDYLNVPSDSNRGSSSEDMSGSAEGSRSSKWGSKSKFFKSKQ